MFQTKIHLKVKNDCVKNIPAFTFQPMSNFLYRKLLEFQKYVSYVKI